MTKKVTLCDPYAWESPEILMSTALLPKLRWEGHCVSELVNQILFVYAVAILLGLSLTGYFKQPTIVWMAFAVATIYLSPSFWHLAYGVVKAEVAEAITDEVPQVTENFRDTNVPTLEQVIGAGVAAPAPVTLPTARNPFMNVLIDEIKYNPTRPQAMAINDPAVKVTLDDFFRTEFNRDPTDVFGRSQSQRQFVAMPSTGIPNDQGSFQNWLYKIDGKTCKEGGREACLPGTDGGQLPWLNADR